MKLIQFLVGLKLIRSNIAIILQHMISFNNEWEYDREGYLNNDVKKVIARVGLFYGTISSHSFVKGAYVELPLTFCERIVLKGIYYKSMIRPHKDDIAILKLDSFPAIEKDLKDKNFSKRTEDLLK